MGPETPATGQVDFTMIKVAGWYGFAGFQTLTHGLPFDTHLGLVLPWPTETVGTSTTDTSQGPAGFGARRICPAGH